jgi:hypothetical protein
MADGSEVCPRRPTELLGYALASCDNADCRRRGRGRLDHTALIMAQGRRTSTGIVCLLQRAEVAPLRDSIGAVFAESPDRIWICAARRTAAPSGRQALDAVRHADPPARFQRQHRRAFRDVRSTARTRLPPIRIGISTSASASAVACKSSGRRPSPTQQRSSFHRSAKRSGRDARDTSATVERAGAGAPRQARRLFPLRKSRRPSANRMTTSFSGIHDQDRSSVAVQGGRC